jgi:hypothetical protein
VISLKHPFWNKIYSDIGSFLSGVNDFQSYMKRIDKLVKKKVNHDPDVLKGDAFEAFVEYWLKSSPNDNRIGISKYQILNELQSDDWGVDGIGIGANGKPATVQVKYRSDPKHQLTANGDGLSNFMKESVFEYNVDKEDSKNMIVIHTAKCIHPTTKSEMLKGKVCELSRSDIQKMVNTVSFWDNFREAIEFTRGTKIF